MARKRSSAASDLQADDGPKLDLKRNVPALLTFLENKITAGASGLYREHFGVGTTEWRILAMLAVEPGITSKRICDVIGFNKAAVSRTVRVLQDATLIVTRIEDGRTRSPKFSLSVKGRRLHDRIICVALERERRLLAPLSADEREALIDMLNRLHRTIPAVNAPIEIPPAHSS